MNAHLSFKRGTLFLLLAVVMAGCAGIGGSSTPTVVVDARLRKSKEDHSDE